MVSVNIFKLVFVSLVLGFVVNVQAGEGHDAGREWAEDKGIADPSDCGGNSSSFIEGCEEYAEEQQAVAKEDEEEE